MQTDKTISLKILSTKLTGMAANFKGNTITMTTKQKNP